MEASLTWLDLTSSDRDKMRRVLDLFSEQGTVDEMGLGSLRDALGDALFPGTSSIQTRLRYTMFIPWIYQGLADARVRSEEVGRAARAAELSLIGALSATGDAEGVIGGRARDRLTRLPSSVYWAGLARWGIFLPPQAQGWYHTHFASLTRGQQGAGRADDPGVVWTRQPVWHPRLPKAPRDFPSVATFNLRRDEAEFVQGRWRERTPGTLLAWLADHGSLAPAMSFWDDPDVLRAPSEILRVVELARRFSRHVEGAPLIYNLLLAERRNQLHGSDAERVASYRTEVAAWAAKEDAEHDRFEPQSMWSFVAQRGVRLPDRQRRFVEAWSTRIREVGAAALVDDGTVRGLVERRELDLKGGRARLANDGRLLDWSGRVGVGRMDFRWFRVRRLVEDLHRGMVS